MSSDVQDMWTKFAQRAKCSLTRAPVVSQLLASQGEASSAELEPLWRPTLHVTGVCAWGWAEIYFIAAPTVHKDSNAEATAITRALDHGIGLQPRDSHAPQDSHETPTRLP